MKLVFEIRRYILLLFWILGYNSKESGAGHKSFIILINFETGAYIEKILP